MEEAVKRSELVVTDGRMYHIRINAKEMARQILVCGDPGRADRIAAHFDTVRHQSQNREYVVRTGTYKEMPITVISTGIGTDNNEIALIEAYGANEFDLESRRRKHVRDPLTIIRVGTCGGIQPEHDCGTLAISSYGLGLDNTGLYYEAEAPDDTSRLIEEEAYRILTDATPDTYRFRGKIHPYCSKADAGVVEALAAYAKKRTVGITATAPGFFAPQGREIPGIPITVPRLQEELRKLDVKGNKVVNFEMESSLLFHLASIMGYRAGTICPIIANRTTGEFLQDYSPAVERAIEAALEAMYALHKRNA